MAIFFIKFGQKEHLKQLYEEGLLYFNNFSFFKKCKNKEQYDKDENITFLYQPDPKASITLDGHKFKLASECRPRIFEPTMHKKYYTHMFCLYSYNKNSPIRSDLKVFDDRLYNFGDYMLVIHNIPEFISRVQTILNSEIRKHKIINAEGRSIEYVDFSSYEGRIETFRKSDKYAHQAEWRIAIALEDYESPYQIKLGSLKDISILMSIKNCKNQIIFDKNMDYEIVL